jgi:hypothetical protein
VLHVTLTDRSNYNDFPFQIHQLLSGHGKSAAVKSPGGGTNFHFSMLSKPALEPTQPPFQWVQGAVSTGVKRPGREAVHSLLTSAKVKKKPWVYTSTPPYVLN